MFCPPIKKFFCYLFLLKSTNNNLSLTGIETNFICWKPTTD